MRISQHATHGYAVADSEHVMRAVVKHWAKLQAFGVTEPEKKRFAQTIARATEVATAETPSPVSLDELRRALEDYVGDYRAAAGLVANGIDGTDKKAEEDLALKGGFPANDIALQAYVKEIGQRMKPYSAKLAARGFGKEKQAELLDAAAAFKKAFAARGKERGSAKAATVSRDALFKQLRTETRYMRRAGRAALKTSVERADFDRVKIDRVAKAAQPPALELEPVAAGGRG
jgi:hypothetical protein